MKNQYVEFSKSPLFVLSLFLIAAPFSAATVSEADTVTFDEFFVLDPPNSASFDFAKFDSSMGGLQMVTIEISADGFLDGLVGDSDRSGGGTVSGTVTGEFVDSEGMFGLLELAGSQDYVVDPFDSGSVTPISVMVKGGGGTVVTDSAASMNYTEAFAGDILVVAFEFAPPQLDGGPDTVFLEDASLSGSVSVTYTFNSVPEPSTFAVLTFACAIALFRRRQPG